MKRKLMLAMILIAQCLSVGAKEGDVVLESKDGHGASHYDEIPTVRYDDTKVTVSTDTLLLNVKLRVSDCQGRQMTLLCVDLSPDAPVELLLPDTYGREKKMIEIVTDKNYYVGYFE